MDVSLYSLVMAMIWFTATARIGHLILHRAEDRGLSFIAMVFLFSVLRIFIPIDIGGSIVIRSRFIYPAVQNCLRYPVAGWISVGNCLLLIWGIGTVFCLLRLMWDVVQQQKFLHSAELQENDSWLNCLFLKAAEEVGYHGPVRLAIAERESSAYQTGLLCPYIILPAQIDRFSDTDICNMFRHELCHFLGGDLWMKIGVQLVSCLLWWNPIMPVLDRSIEQLLELRCDRRACRYLPEEEQLLYLGTLIKLAKCDSADVSQVCLGYLRYDNKEDVKQRFRMLLMARPSPVMRIKQGVSYILCFSLFLASYCVILQPWIPPDIGDSESEYVITTFSPESSYIICESGGTLRLYCNGNDLGEIAAESLDIEPFKSMQIVYK